MARKPSADKPAALGALVRFWALSLIATLHLTACSREKPLSVEADAPSRHHATEEQASMAMSSPPAPESPRSPRVVCPRYGAPAAQGTLREPQLAEISGLGRSSAPDLFWVHNDSGDEARVYALSAKAEWLATYRLLGVPEASDVEDIAVVTRNGRSQIHLGDIGDNQRRRKDIAVHRFDEPEVDVTTGFASPHPERPTGPVTTVHFSYPDGAQDAEAFVVDPRTGTLVIVTKTFFSPPKVYEKELFSSGELTAKGEMSETLTGAVLQLVTAADVSTSGDFVAVRTYDGAYLFRRHVGQSIAAALMGPACPLPTGPEKQGEALTLLDASDGPPVVATMSEGKVTTLWITRPN